jgi:hypothetical protein
LRATMSLLGLYQNNDQLFNDFQIPEDLDKDILVQNLLCECAELEILYPQPYFMQTMIGLWSGKEKPVWDKLYKTTVLEYNPISNYDLEETWTDNEYTTNDGTANISGNSESDSSVDTERERTSDKTSNNEDSKSAYNETTFTPTDRNVGIAEENENIGQNERASANLNSEQNTKTSDNGTRDSTHTGSFTGNTGFYTKQKMIEQERDIAKFNIYNYIIESFKNRFCLLIY